MASLISGAALLRDAHVRNRGGGGAGRAVGLFDWVSCSTWDVNMRCTAVIHLRRRPTALEGASLERALRQVRGIDTISVEPAEVMITVAFDRDVTGLADIVRIIEDGGCPVVGVAQRHDGEALAG